MNSYQIRYELFRNGEMIARRREYVEASSFMNAIAKLAQSVDIGIEINLLGC